MPEPTSPEPPPLPVVEACMSRLGRALGLGVRAAWGGPALTREEVLAAWREGRLAPEPLGRRASREQHLARVAWFCAHGWHAPARVVAGPGGAAQVEDGEHRLLAAWVLRHRVASVQLEDPTGGLQANLRATRAPDAPFYPSPMQLGPHQTATTGAFGRAGSAPSMDRRA